MIIAPTLKSLHRLGARGAEWGSDKLVKLDRVSHRLTGRSKREARHDFVALACRAHRGVQVRLFI